MRSTSMMIAGLVGTAMTFAASDTMAQDWHPFSRNSERVYLADVGSITVAGDVTSIRVARVSRKPASPADYSHVVEDYEFRCAATQVKVGTTTEYGPDGAQTDQYDDGADWDAIRPNTMDDYVRPLACDGEMASPPTWPTLKAFMDAGRGG